MPPGYARSNSPRCASQSSTAPFARSEPGEPLRKLTLSDPHFFRKRGYGMKIFAVQPPRYRVARLSWRIRLTPTFAPFPRTGLKGWARGAGQGAASNGVVPIDINAEAKSAGKRIFVPDLGTAEWLQSHFPRAKLTKSETGYEKLGLSVKRGRKRVYGSDAERKRASRTRQKEKKLNDSNDLLNFEIPTDSELQKNQIDQGGHDMSMCTNSNSVTGFMEEFRGSLFHDKYSKKKPFDCYSTKTIGDFERELDAVKTEKQISRSAFIRESLTRNLLYYDKYERDPVCFPRDEVEFNDTGPSEHPVEIREEKGEPWSEINKTP